MIILLLACISEPTEFGLCLDGLEIACECGVGPCLEEDEARRSCADYNMRYCDAGSGVYDSEMCRTAQENQDELDYLVCFNLVLTAECDSALAAATCT